MTRTQRILAVFGILAVIVASAAPAMAQSSPPWGENDSWIPPDQSYPSSYPSDYYNQGYPWGSPSGYYDDAYKQFKDNCLGVVSGDKCIGVGEDLDYYLSNYDGGSYGDPYNQNSPYGDPYWNSNNQDSPYGNPYWNSYPQQG